MRLNRDCSSRLVADSALEVNRSTAGQSVVVYKGHIWEVGQVAKTLGEAE